ncbi:tetratricopeptide repeat protein [Ekhidna sp.]
MNLERIQLLKTFIQDEPLNPFNKYALAMEYYEEAPDDALELLRDLRKAHPEYLPLYFKLAHLLWEEELWDEANDVFSEGIKLAEEQSDRKALSELKSAYQNFEFDKD